MLPGNYPIVVKEGATFTLPFRVGSKLVDGDGNPVLDSNGREQVDVGRDFTGCTFRAQMRVAQKPTATLMATITSEDSNGGISADDSGNVMMVWPDEQMDGVTKNGWWDIKCYNVDGTEDCLLEGTVTVDRAITADV